MTPRYLKPGEHLAIASNHLNQDRKGFFWMFGAGSPPSERKGNTTVIHVRGPLEHHGSEYAYAESYEGIIKKMSLAYSGEDAVRAHERQHKYDDDYTPMEATQPERIVLCIDSPGGVVSGLNECVAALQRMRDANPGVELCAYVNEMACSAAYALACACDEIVAPPSAILGSIGVISTMVSVSEADKKDGIDVRLITSGARKADGNMHAPISDGAIEAETARVDKLAKAFFRLVSKARNLTMAKVESFQAGIFLGKDAKRVGLADDLASYDSYISPATQLTDDKEPMNIQALLRRLAAEQDPKKIEAISAELGAAMIAAVAAKKPLSKKKDDENDDEDSDEDDQAETVIEPVEAKTEPVAVPEDDDDEDVSQAASKALALVESLTGEKGAGARGKLRAIVMLAAKTNADVQELKKLAKDREKSELIASVSGKFFTPKEAEELAGMPLAEVRSLVGFAKKRGFMVHTDESTLVKPKNTPGSAESLPKETLDMIEESLASAPVNKREQYRAELVAAHLKAHNDQIATAMNGAGRY